VTRHDGDFDSVNDGFDDPKKDRKLVKGKTKKKKRKDKNKGK